MNRMTGESSANSDRELRLDEIVTAYLKAVEAGEQRGSVRLAGRGSSGVLRRWFVEILATSRPPFVSRRDHGGQSICLQPVRQLAFCPQRQGEIVQPQNRQGRTGMGNGCYYYATGLPQGRTESRRVFWKSEQGHAGPLRNGCLRQRYLERGSSPAAGGSRHRSEVRRRRPIVRPGWAHEP